MTYAFPHNTVVVDKEGGIIEHHKGMELRDYFAAQALTGAQIWDAVINGQNAQFNQGTEKLAEVAYAVADAMLAARETTKGETHE
jgi:hypothetical protein